ncbi:MAG TPA: uracil-DNA glycosylase [Bacteroidales bacterium]|nr:uracil-DNA glycosylase [Bacteroidales bacterium]
MKPGEVLNAKERYLQELSRQVRQCRLCRLSETRRHAVPAEGNPQASIMIIAQAPGREEDKKGRMFIGPSGRVLDRLFDRIRLNRNQLYMTNLLKCFLPNCRKPRSDEIEACHVYLSQEIKTVNPDVLVPLGYHPTKTIFHKYNLTVPNRHHFPELFGKLKVSGSIKILPLRHPATVVHQSAAFDQLLRNYRKLEVMGKICKWYDQCPVPRFYEQGKLNKKWLDLYCRGDWESCKRYQLQGRNVPHPDHMLPNGQSDHNL